MKIQDLDGKNIGLVLSGGGVRGMAHIGILKALNEHDIYPDIISGVSAGAIVGALYANGKMPLGMLAFFKETPLSGTIFFRSTGPDCSIPKNTYFFSRSTLQKIPLGRWRKNCT